MNLHMARERGLGWGTGMGMDMVMGMDTNMGMVHGCFSMRDGGHGT